MCVNKQGASVVDVLINKGLRRLPELHKDPTVTNVEYYSCQGCSLDLAHINQSH